MDDNEIIMRIDALKEENRKLKRYLRFLAEMVLNDDKEAIERLIQELREP